MSRTRTITLTLGSIAAGAVLATGVTGLALADDRGDSTAGSSADSSAGLSTSPDSTIRGIDPHARGEGRRGGLESGPGIHAGMHGAPMGQALHGETVVKAEDGTISTVRMVSGTVTAVSAASITVTAEDGYVGTFALSAETEVHTGLPQRGQAPSTGSIADIAVGDIARVHGPVTGGTATAEDLHALTPEEFAQLEQLRQEHDQQSRPGRDAQTSSGPDVQG